MQLELNLANLAAFLSPKVKYKICSYRNIKNEYKGCGVESQIFLLSINVCQKSFYHTTAQI